MIIDIVPKELVKIYTIEKIDVTISDLKLNESVTLNILMLDNNSELIEVKNITLEGEDYALWSSEDDYVISKVCQLLDLTRS